MPHRRSLSIAPQLGCRCSSEALNTIAFEPLGQFTLDRISLADSNDPRLAEDLVRFPLFAAMKFPRPRV